MTHFCSENRTGRDILNDNASGSKKIVGIKSVNYDLEIYFYKEGEPEEKWALLDPCYLNSILFDEDLFSIFPTVKISFGGQNTKDPIQFEGNSTDRVYIFLSKTIVDNLKPNENEPKIPYPIIDCEFVIWNMERTPNENVHAQNQTSVTTLTLIPFAQFKLLTTYPQWTTGFDAGSTFSRINITNPVFKEMSDMMNPGAGKPTGVCIKEILKKCDFDVDEGNDLFDDGIARINYTIPLRQSALDAISYILTYHLSKKNNDACVFKYNQFSKKFILPPFTKLFKNKIDDDEMAKRKAAFDWKFDESKYPRFLNLFVKNVGSMAHGGIWE